VAGCYAELRALGGEAVAVSFTPPGRVAAYLQTHPLPFPAVSDPERAAYRALSLGRTSWASFLRLNVLARYLKLMFRGWRPEAPAKGEDVLQLGGDFVIDAAGRLAYAYRSRTATDRPPAQALLEAVQAARSSPLAPATGPAPGAPCGPAPPA
jgi:peroxiredoxin